MENKLKEKISKTIYDEVDYHQYKFCLTGVNFATDKLYSLIEDVLKPFHQWAYSVAWYDNEYGLWNLHDGEERLEYAFDQFRFDDKEFFNYFTQHIYKAKA